MQREGSLVLVAVFLGLAELVLACDGTGSFEWPAHCVGWHIPALKQFFEIFNFKSAECHGCALGLKHRGNRVKKTWKIMSTHAPKNEELSDRKCKCQRGAHAPCTGAVASASENYTPKMATLVVKGVLLPGVESVAPPDGTFRSCNARPDGENGGLLDLSYAGGGEEDFTEADRAMFARFSDGSCSHRQKMSVPRVRSMAWLSGPSLLPLLSFTQQRARQQ